MADNGQWDNLNATLDTNFGELYSAAFAGDVPLRDWLWSRQVEYAMKLLRRNALQIHEIVGCCLVRLHNG